MQKKHCPLLALLLALAMVLTACGQDQNTGSQGEDGEGDLFTVTTAVSGAQDTLDPGASTAQGGETILFHLYENLMRWSDGGDGHAVLSPGQALSYEVETDYAGNATYTFTLRQGIQWSDGEAVTAQDFAAAWRRLADPANDLPHRELLSVVSGYDQVQETGDPSLLAVSAPDDGTFVVTLNGSPAYFLEELCAGAYTMPVREDLISGGSLADGSVTNGAYTATSLSSREVELTRSETYYDSAAVGPDVLRFVTVGDSESDYEAYLAGELDLIQDLPASVLQELESTGTWLPEAVTATYAVVLNTQQPPFDDVNVRQAFRLAVDTQALVDALGDLTARAAVGLIPYGVTDYGQHEEAAEEEPAVPDPNAAPVQETPEPQWDFRIHSQELVTLPESGSYEENCRQAQALMAQAGYAGGGSFPVVEYLYVESDAGRAVAQALQSMWQEQLGVTVTVRGVSQEEYDAALSPAQPAEGEEAAGGEEAGSAVPAFQMAGQLLTAQYSDAEALLAQWYTGHENNLSGYSSDAFDILLDSARAAVSPDARDAYLHDGEAILLNDAPVIPLYYLGGSYQLRDGLTGLYRAPDGVYFLSAVAEAS